MAPVLRPDRQIYVMPNVDALDPEGFELSDEERLATFAALLGSATYIVSGEPDVTWTVVGVESFDVC